MKLKRIAAFLLAGAMVFSLTACGSGTGSEKASTDRKKDSKADKLVIWTLSADLEQFAEKYTEKTGIKCETVIVEAGDYQTKVQSAILAGEKEPDIIVGEPDMLPSMMEAGLFEDLDQYGAQDYKDKIVDYVWKKGQDVDGSQKAISYQITPAGIYYRRDIAAEVFGTEEPEEIGKLFADYDTIIKTGDKLKAAGYKIFASDGEIGYFTGSDPWVVDGKLNVSQTRKDYMDLSIKLYQGGYTAFATPWTAPLYQAMSGEIPVFEADTNLWDEEERKEAEANAKETTQVFAYGLPSWGVLTMRDNYKETEGKWGICKGPAYGMGGGTYVGISSKSERKDTAWDFVKFCTLTEETMEWWIGASKGDTVSYIPTLEKHAEDENEVYGGQKLYKFWMEQAEGIDLSKVTEYDRAIADAWNSAMNNIKTGQMSKEDAMYGFYDEVLQANHIDVVFTDIRMPKMDGITLLNRMQELVYSPHVIVISGYEDFNYAVEAMKTGVEDYILKPIDREKLSQILISLESTIQREKENRDKKKNILNQQLKYLILNEEMKEPELKLIREEFQKISLVNEYIVLCGVQLDFITADKETYIEIKDMESQTIVIAGSKKRKEILETA